MNDKLATTHRAELATPEPDSFIAFLERASKDPAFDVAKFEAIMQAKERSDAQERKRLYFEAMAALQADVAPVAKSGKNDHTRSRYVRLDDLLVVLRPLLDKHGFAISFDCKPLGNDLEFSCTFAHRAGHSDTKTLPLPRDGTGAKGGHSSMNSLQAVGSTTSYARRYLIEMHLNIARRGEDNDGAGAAPPVSFETAVSIRETLEAEGGDAGRFLSYMRVGTFEEITERDLSKARAYIRDLKKAR